MKSKNVLITGGNSGIGYATAVLFSQRGYNVTISGRDENKLKLAATELGADFFVADLADLNQLESLSETFTDGLDVLVNNGAMAQFMPIEAHTKEIFDLNISTNVHGPLYLIQKLLPSLEKKSGAIVNVSSLIVDNGKPNASLYAATKGAIEALTRSLALELAPRGVRVNAVSPGAIDTPIVHKLGIPEDEIPALLTHQAAAIPLKRLGKPEEVAEVIFAQATASYVTGAVWKVDGGVDAE